MLTADAIDSFLTSKRTKGLSERTLASYSYRLKVFARLQPELLTDPTSIESFLAKTGPSLENRETYYRLLRNFYNVIVKRRLVSSNPVLEIESPLLRPKLARSLAPEALNLLLTHPSHSPHIVAFLYLLADTGIRLSEALSVSANDFGSGTVVVTGKTGEREVPISPLVRGMVLDALPWPWSSYQAAGLAVRRAFRRAGITGRRASAHTLRHTFVRLWDGDETLLQGILGWTSLRMMKIYRPYNLKRAIAQHAQYGPLRQLTGSKQLPLL